MTQQPRVDKEILEFLKAIQKIAAEYNKKLSSKVNKVQEMSAIMDENKVHIGKEIDDYFDMLIKELNDRRNKLKDDYIQIEQSHRKRVIRSSLKLKALGEEMTHTLSEIELGISDFGTSRYNSHRIESDLAFTANRALYKSAYNRLRLLQSHIMEPTYIKKTRYKAPEFKHLPGTFRMLTAIRRRAVHKPDRQDHR